MEGFLGDRSPYILVLPMVLVAASVRGLWAGLLATILGVLGVDLWIVPPSSSLSLHLDEKTMVMFLSLAAGVVVSILAGLMRSAQQRSRQAEEAATKASAAKDHFLAALSHELRTPLMPVMAGAQALLEDARLPADAHEDLQIMQRNVALEVRLIDDLLDLTRIARGKLHLETRPIDVAVVLRDVSQICSPDLDAKRQQLTLEIPDLPYPMEADAARLHQVFWNLLKNAIKFTPREGSIRIRCHKDPGPDADGQPSHDARRVVIEVSDTGIGIESEVLSRVFDPFEQGERSITRQFGGLGLGLSITKSIVEMHGGRIWASSPGKGKGTTFTVELPLVASVEGEPSCTANDKAEADGGHLSAATRLHILLVEDHADTARMLARLLAAEGHDVKTAGTVAATLELAATDDFDIIISDLGLPDGSGRDLMRQLRTRRPDIRGIALSGYGAEADVRESLDAGFREHLVKPVDLQGLNDALIRAASEGKLPPARQRTH